MSENLISDMGFEMKSDYNGVQNMNVESSRDNNTAEGHKEQIDNSAENTLNVIAAIVLFLGLISSIVMLATIVYVEQPSSSLYSHRTETVFNIYGFFTMIGTLLTSVTTWAFLRVIANISISLKEIKRK